MAIEGIFYVTAFVSDLTRSKRFYGETLGWTLNTDEPSVAGFWFGKGYLVVLQDNRPEDQRCYGGGMHVAVTVDDLEAQHARLTELCVAVSPIQVRPWGESNFSFADPDGYAWDYSQSRG